MTYSFNFLAGGPSFGFVSVSYMAADGEEKVTTSRSRWIGTLSGFCVTTVQTVIPFQLRVSVSTVKAKVKRRRHLQYIC